MSTVTAHIRVENQASILVSVKTLRRGLVGKSGHLSLREAKDLYDQSCVNWCAVEVDMEVSKNFEKDWTKLGQKVRFPTDWTHPPEAPIHRWEGGYSNVSSKATHEKLVERGTTMNFMELAAEKALREKDYKTLFEVSMVLYGKHRRDNGSRVAQVIAATDATDEDAKDW